MTDDGKRKNGLLLTGSIKIRSPLNHQLLIKPKKELWISIPMYSNSQCISSSTTEIKSKSSNLSKNIIKSHNSSFSTPSSPNDSDKKNKIVLHERSKTTNIVEKETKQSNLSIEEDVDYDFYDTSKIFSNLVLENEIRELDNILKPVRKDKSQNELWLERKNNYEIRLSLLVCQVEAGLLTPTSNLLFHSRTYYIFINIYIVIVIIICKLFYFFVDYMEQLSNAINQEKQRAVFCKNNHRLDLSKKYLIRMKWMEQELEEIKSSSLLE